MTSIVALCLEGIQALPVFSVGPRGRAGLASEEPAEVRGVGEAKLVCHDECRLVRISKQPFCLEQQPNIQITRSPSPVTLSPAAKPPVQYVWNWQASDPAPAAGAIKSLPLSIEKWTAARAEESGLVNINRLFSVQKGRSVVFAKHTIRSDAARRVLAGIGYSDDVTVFVNGEPIYTGINAWDSRTPQLASFVDARWESAFLPFREGDNEIVLAVADDQRFGWGFALRIGDATGLKF